ncbi:MAG: hypothetical protein ACYS80_10905 [Planctomycetota bacterium]|jgi:hypothetical protein
MSDTEEKNDNRQDEEEAIPTASFGAGAARPGGQRTTKAGGARREDWPEWMRNFKDY